MTTGKVLTNLTRERNLPGRWGKLYEGGSKPEKGVGEGSGRKKGRKVMSPPLTKVSSVQFSRSVVSDSL